MLFAVFGAHMLYLCYLIIYSSMITTITNPIRVANQNYHTNYSSMQFKSNLALYITTRPYCCPCFRNKILLHNDLFAKKLVSTMASYVVCACDLVIHGWHWSQVSQRTRNWYQISSR